LCHCTGFFFPRNVLYKKKSYLGELLIHGTHPKKKDAGISGIFYLVTGFVHLRKEKLK